jgi:hypothetical protein
VANGPLEQGTPHDLGRVWELLGEPVANFDDLFLFHSTK